MISNASGTWPGYLAGAYPGDVGHLYGPGGQRGPYPFMPYGTDNNGYILWQANLDTGGDEWIGEPPWLELMDWAASKKQKPLFSLAPDKVADRLVTLRRWFKYAPMIRARGIRPAFAVQDDMTFSDVPDDDCMLFLGGTTPWKNAAIGPWCRRFPGRVHVARVTERDRLWQSYRAGAVSVDGNDWWRDTAKPGCEIQRDVLIEFLEMQKRERRAA